MGKRIVRVSKELFKEFFIQGRTFPPFDGERITITCGVPEDAVLESISSDLYSTFDDVAIRFSHPSWEPTPPGSQLLEMRVDYVREVTDPEKYFAATTAAMNRSSDADGAPHVVEDKPS